MKDLKFKVEREVLDLGVRIVTARISNVSNRKTDSEFEKYKEVELENIRGKFKDTNDVLDDPIISGFRELHKKIGRSNIDYVASPEALRKAFLKKDRFPHINLIVDIYNLESLKTGLALGAHDIRYINGNVSLRLTKGDENFIPLGSTEPVSVYPNEYGYIDDENNIICRLEVLQVDQTKIVEESSDIFLIVQGNLNTSQVYLEDSTNNICKNITKYCGGEYTVLENMEY